MTQKARTRPTDQDAAQTFLAALDHPRKPEIEALRLMVLGSDPAIREAVKWNSLSFLTTDHFATFRLRPENIVQIVFHTGAKVRAIPLTMKIDDPLGVLKWVAPDRAVATFRDLDDIESKREALHLIVQQWAAQL